jgi:hypothetical protein
MRISPTYRRCELTSNLDYYGKKGSITTGFSRSTLFRCEAPAAASADVGWFRRHLPCPSRELSNWPMKASLEGRQSRTASIRSIPGDRCPGYFDQGEAGSRDAYVYMVIAILWESVGSSGRSSGIQTLSRLKRCHSLINDIQPASA